MRQDTDFVLEQAAWPALLVEETGAIRRANRAARHVFGQALPGEGIALTTLLPGQDPEAARRLLGGNAEEQFSKLELRLSNGQNGQFVAHLSPISRDGQVYFLLQLFKESGSVFPELGAIPMPLPVAPPPAPAPPPVPAPHPAPIPHAPPAPTPATEEPFVLEHASWPALLVDHSGGLLGANHAAVEVFGSHVQKEDFHFPSLWSTGNAITARQFIDAPPAEPIRLQLRLKSGIPSIFLTQCCLTGKDQNRLVQMMTELDNEAGAAPRPAPPVNPASLPSEPAPAAPTNQAVEASLAHKQKLDCALQLARTVALDFNNALTSILGHTSLLLSKAEASNPWRNSLVEIEKSAAKAAEIANDLAAFSRQEKDTTRTQSSGNLNALLERTVDLFRAKEERPIQWALHLERKLYTANFDEAKMQQAIMKVLENSIQAIQREGKIALHTKNLELAEPTQDRTAKLNPGNYVCVEIVDNGEGIAADALPRVFEPFFTTKGAKHRGLGMAFVYGIVTNHGGGVSVLSQPGHGCTVRIYIPANRQVVKSVSVSTGDLSGHQTVLIVDDEDLLLTMGQMVLTSYGYKVLTANSGQKAMEVFTKSRASIDLVITDLVMPNMSGRELTEHIHKLSPDTRVVWSSGYLRGENAQENEFYLQKPFTSQDLLRKVKQALAQ